MKAFPARLPSCVASYSSAQADASPMPDGPRCGATVKRMKPRHCSSRNIGPTVLQCTFSAVAVENHADMFDEIDVVDILAAALNRAPLQCASPFGWGAMYHRQQINSKPCLSQSR